MERQNDGSVADDGIQDTQASAEQTPSMPQIAYATIVDEVAEYLARGEKLNAIERVKALTGMGTQGAKAFVEHMEVNQKR